MEYCGLNFECKKVGPEKISTNIFSYQIMFVSFNSNTMGVTRGAGIANPPGVPKYFPWIICSCYRFMSSSFVPGPGDLLSSEFQL